MEIPSWGKLEALYGHTALESFTYWFASLPTHSFTQSLRWYQLRVRIRLFVGNEVASTVRHIGLQLHG